MGRRRKFTTRSWISLAGLAGLLVLTSGPVSAVQLLGSNQSGALVSIDTTTGMGTLIGVEAGFPLATEIEFDVATGTLYSEEVNGFLNLHTLDPATGLSLGLVTHGCCALTGMEFVGSTLYVSNTQVGGGHHRRLWRPSTPLPGP